MTEKLAYRLPEAARVLSIGQTKMKGLIRAGEIGVVKHGMTTIIPRDEIERFLATKTRIQAPRNDAQS